MSQSFGSWGGMRLPRGGGGFGDAATPPSAAPESTNTGSMRRAPPARTNAGQFAGAPRQADEDYDYAAESEDQDEDDDVPHAVVVGNVGKGQRNVTTVRAALIKAAPGALHVKTRANNKTTLALCFGNDSRHNLAGNGNVQKVVNENCGELLFGRMLWRKLATLGITQPEFERQVAIVLHPPPPQQQPQPARAPPPRRAAPAPPPRRAARAPPPAPPPAPPAVDFRLFAEAQRLARNGGCPGCGGPMLFQVALEPLGVNADICPANNLKIAAGQPFLICKAFHEDGEEQSPKCLMRAYAGNCPQLSNACR